MKNSDRVWTVLSMLEWATGYFKQRGIPDPRLSIEWILAEALDVKRLDLYLQFERPLSTEELDRIRPLVKRRAAHEPLQHITGTTDFLKSTIRVNRHVLIPRIETEQLVDRLLEDFANHKDEPVRLLDIGTGSGCIPISIKKECPAWSCTGIDISEEALETAGENARFNEVDVDFYQADIRELSEWQKSTGGNWDIVISNPPYITPDEKSTLDRQVRDHEPSLALFHDEPLLLYENIIRFASANGAALYLECNHRTASEVEKIANQYYSASELLQDLDGNDRFVVCRKS